MITWGISANSHDAALAVFDNDELKFASHSERFSGIKNDPHLNKELINYALNWGEPNEVVWYERPFRKTLRQLRAGQGWNWNENNIKKYLNSYGITAPIRYTSHHHSHAAAGYYTSPFSDATVVCIDSIGEFETFTVWRAEHNVLTKVYSQGYPHSIGLWYSAMTQRIGLKPNEDEYILMGMAAYGNPSRLFLNILNDFVGTEGMGINPRTQIRQNLHRGCLGWRKDLTTQQDKFDIAAGTQAVYEYVLLNILCWASRHLPSKNLVLMGGCALNCKANGSAYRFFDNVWIMPNPGDAGSAIGSVLAYKGTRIDFKDAFLGYNIEGEYPVEAALLELSTTGVCGIASGRAEFGPRALGNRSLLADPRGQDIKDRVNEIKQRQLFRPFAPAILAECYSDYFTGHAGPYMQFTAKCKRPDLYPGITHADGTSRVQTVSRGSGTGLRRLLEAWYEKTGCPMLLNTSLNIKGKPMVNDLTDAEEFATMYNVKVFTGNA